MLMQRKSNSQMMQMDVQYGITTQGTALEEGLHAHVSNDYADNVQISEGPSLHAQDFSANVDDHSDLEADSMPESQLELTEADVYTRLEYKERDLLIAAELGKSLLDKNEELLQENERLNQEYTERIEVLEQEKFELRQRLEYKSSECEASTVELSGDILRTQEELEERKAMLAASEREKTRAIEELAEQNRKLLEQLQLASDAEEKLSAQVQQLRQEFLERTTSSDVKILQLESLKEEIQEGTERQTRLEAHCGEMKDETVELREALTSSTERIHHLERQLHDRERELKSVMIELNDSRVSNRQLQTRVDELREEISLQASFASNGNASSLLSELEQSGIDQSEIFNFGASLNDSGQQNTCSSPDEDHNKALSSRSSLSHEAGNSTDRDERTPEVTLRYYQALMNSVNNCHFQLFQLKQEMWDAYQRLQTICTYLRSFVQKREEMDTEKLEHEEELDEPQSPTAPANLASTIDDLSSLVKEAVKTKVMNGQAESDLVQTLKEKQAATQRERDEAVAAKNAAEVNLVRAKTDLMSVNSQLLEAIQQKLQQQKELEAWQDDMEHMIQKALNERNSVIKAKTLKRIQAQTSDPPHQRSSWFSFGKARQASGDSPKSTAANGGSASYKCSQSPRPSRPSTPDTNSPVTSRFAAWLWRKQNTDPPSDSQSTESHPG